MKTIDVSTMKSGDSKTEFEKVSDTEVLEYVVQVRSRKTAELQTQADEIDTSVIDKEARIVRDKEHTTRLRQLAALPRGQKLTIDNTHA